MSETVDITGIDKAELLAALHNRSHPQGLGVLHDIGRDLTVEEAAKLIDEADGGRRPDDHGRRFGLRSRGRLYFDYLYGRPLKVDISGNEVAPWGYDRDNGGPGTLASIVDGLRES